nr:MAG TPA: Neck appendage protein [Caudoviricetes sp.]
MNNLENLATAIGTDIKDIKTQATNSQAKISANTESIARITTQIDSLATKSEVKQDIDGLAKTLAKVQVGGRNYYRDSEKVRTSTRFFPFPIHPYLSQENIGETWTLSFDLKINEGGEIRSLHFYHYQNNRFGLKASANITPSKEWQRFTFTGPVIFPNDDSRYSRGEMALYDYGGNNNYSVRRIKLEKGTLATDWSPAPEDAQTQVTETQESLRGLERKFETFKEQQFTKEEFNSKDCITGSTEYQVLKHQVESLVKQTQTLQEQLALVKPAPRRAPMAYTIDLNNTPPIAWFDNGCGLDIGGNLILLGANRSQGFGNNAPLYDFPNAIIRTSMGIINVDVWKKANFDYWHATVKVLNPLKSADDYDWTNARLSEQGSLASWRWDNQKNVIRVMYQLGVWDGKTVESLGAVRR